MDILHFKNKLIINHVEKFFNTIAVEFSDLFERVIKNGEKVNYKRLMHFCSLFLTFKKKTKLDSYQAETTLKSNFVDNKEETNIEPYQDNSNSITTELEAEPEPDFDNLNVYTQSSFILKNKNRNREFFYCRYYGNNYKDMKDLFAQYSPNTEIWEESALEKNVLYDYSGNTGQFQKVNELEIRCIIASNPYIKIDGIFKPLFFSTKYAEKYLKANKYHRVFRYGYNEEVLDTYAYDPIDNCFKLYNYAHPKGTENPLPESKEWFICIKDKLYHSPIKYVVIPTKDQHTVRFKRDLTGFIDDIEDQKYNINEKAYHQNKTIIFQPSWNYFHKIKTLRKQCNSKEDFKNFINEMYHIIFEETKRKKTAKASLGKFKNDDFVTYVNELRNGSGAHDKASYKAVNQEITYETICQHYLGHNSIPRPEEYFDLQKGLLEDFKIFLDKIFEGKYAEKCKAIIQRDDNGYIHCSNCLLPEIYGNFVGNECECITFKEHPDDKLKNIYPFYCERPEYIMTKYNGIVEFCEEFQKCFCGPYRLNLSMKQLCGHRIKNLKIKPYKHKYMTPQKLGEVVDYEFDNDLIDGKEYEGIIVKVQDNKNKKRTHNNIKCLNYSKTLRMKQKNNSIKENDNVLFIATKEFDKQHPSTIYWVADDVRIKDK